MSARKKNRKFFVISKLGSRIAANPPFSSPTTESSVRKLV